jgi:long-chain acyl-CoA synthetase
MRIMREFKTFPELVDYIEKNYQNPCALSTYSSGIWHNLSSKELVDQVKALANGLIDLGLNRGEKVGILSPSTALWTIADLASIYAGGVTVPLFSNISDVNFVYEVGQSNVRILFVEGHDQWKVYERHRNLFDHVIGLDDCSNYPEAIPYKTLLTQGQACAEKQSEHLLSIAKDIKTTDVATIIYTSGSTGVPKGAEITHQNLLHLATFETFEWDPKNDKYLSILPLAHIFARQINTILLAWNISIYYLNDLHAFSHVCKAIKPRLMIVVPRVLEKIYTQLKANTDKVPALIRPLYRFALNLADEPKKWSIKQLLFHKIMDFLVYRNIRKEFGDNWRIIICGGAKLNLKLNYFFLRVGFPIFEGFGLTEGSTPIVNTNKARKVGTVGQVLPEVFVKIAETGELLIKGPTVMKGYHNDHRATHKIIDANGWLHTGDKAQIDREGFITLIGRIKEQFKLSSGEYVSPGRIEQSLCQSPLIDMALVNGEAMRFASCLLFPDFLYLRKMKKNAGKAHLSDEEFLKSKEVTDTVKALIGEVNQQFNSWEQLQRWRIIPESLSIDRDELTPTQKIRRQVVLEKYKKIIEEMYSKETHEI